MAETKWDADPEVLHAVLTFLDEHDVPATISSSSLPTNIPHSPTLIDYATPIRPAPSPVNGAVVSAPTRLPVSHKQRKRLREKHLIQKMHDEVRELEMELTSWQERIQRRSHQQVAANASGTRVAHGSHSAPSLLTHCWREFAERQLTQRMASETENARLRRLVDEQARVNARFQRILTKQVKLEDILHTPNALALALARNDMTPSSSSAMCREVKMALVSMFQDVDGMFMDARFLDDDVSFRDTSVKMAVSNGRAVHDQEARLLPFAWEIATDALWQLACQPPSNSPLTVNEVTMEADGSTIVKSFTAQIILGGFSCEFRGHMGISRVDADNRGVMVRTIIVQSAHVNGEPLPNIHIQRDDWTVIQPSSQTSGNTCSAATPASRLLAAGITHIQTKTQRPGDEDLLAFLVKSTREVTPRLRQKYHERVDNALLAHSTASRPMQAALS